MVKFPFKDFRIYNIKTCLVIKTWSGMFWGSGQTCTSDRILQSESSSSSSLLAATQHTGRPAPQGHWRRRQQRSSIAALCAYLPWKRGNSRIRDTARADMNVAKSLITPLGLRSTRINNTGFVQKPRSLFEDSVPLVPEWTEGSGWLQRGARMRVSSEQGHVMEAQP